MRVAGSPSEQKARDKKGSRAHPNRRKLQQPAADSGQFASAKQPRLPTINRSITSRAVAAAAAGGGGNRSGARSDRDQSPGRGAARRGVEAGRRGEDTGACARGDGLVAEEGRPAGAPRARRCLHPRPRAQDRQWRQPSEASRGCADLWIQGRAGDVRDADVGARGHQEAQTAGDLGASVSVVRAVVVDRGHAIETPCVKADVKRSSSARWCQRLIAR